MNKAADFIREIDSQLADFLDEELKDIPESKYPSSTDYIPTTEELKNFTEDELTDLLLDVSIDADITYGTSEFEALNERYETIKRLILNEKTFRKKMKLN